jgi:hypothetical protein
MEAWWSHIPLLQSAAVFGCVCVAAADWVGGGVFVNLHEGHAPGGVVAPDGPEVPGAVADEADLACAPSFLMQIGDAAAMLQCSIGLSLCWLGSLYTS